MKYLIFPTLFCTIHLDNEQKNCKIENNLIIVFTLSFFWKVMKLSKWKGRIP